MSYQGEPMDAEAIEQAIAICERAIEGVDANVTGLAPDVNASIRAAASDALTCARELARVVPGVTPDTLREKMRAFVLLFHDAQGPTSRREIHAAGLVIDGGAVSDMTPDERARFVATGELPPRVLRVERSRS